MAASITLWLSEWSFATFAVAAAVQASQLGSLLWTAISAVAAITAAMLRGIALRRYSRTQADAIISHVRTLMGAASPNLPSNYDVRP